MVRVALRELAEEGGSSEASISRYIQSSYTQLPPGHSRLLPYYLGKFVAAGDVSMPSPNRFALPPIPPSPPLFLPRHYPIPTPNHHPNNPNPRRSSFRQKPAGPQIPRRRGRPPKRKKAAAPSGSAAGCLMLPPWPTTSPCHVTDSSASPPPRRGRGRPRKNPETKAPTPAVPATVGEPVPRPRLIIRLRSKPSNPMPDTAAAAAASEMTTVMQSELSEPDVEMLHMDQMQPEPEGGLLLLQPESEFLLPAQEPPENNEDQSLPTSAKPETRKDRSVPATIRLKSIEESSPPAVQANAESLFPASVHLEPEPSEEPLASAQLHIEAKELNESMLPQVSAYSEPCKELLVLDPMRAELEEELLRLLPLQSETELELWPPPGPAQSALHEEPMLSISAQPETEEQLALPAPWRMELMEISSHLAPEQPESIEETLLQPELDEEYLPPALLLPEPKEEPLLLPSIRIEPREELLSLASIEPEVKEGSSPPAPFPAAEKSEKSGHSSKHRRTHAKHRRLWFEC
ncbi:serine/arginine repetitive matrix protein 1-like isoform X2 [Phoenix dactylifera]|nr:serine/arginine repetitive matrix protein 1-like isoform X2 [Phoenix dactylifera]